MSHRWVLLVSLLLSTSTIHALNLNGVGKLPVLGYNTWNAFSLNINETIILSTAREMVSQGLVKAGYNYMNIDDAWQAPTRNSEGHLVPDPVKFPRGMKALSDDLKKMGLNMGLYSDNGYKTCGGYPGSFGYELTDARDFVSWGVTLLKFDNCYMPIDTVSRQNEPGKYSLMTNAIAQVAKETGVALQLNICEWGVVQPWLWAKEYGTSWRATQDIEANWASIMSITNLASFVPGYTDFYGRNDLDILEVGNGDMTFEENKSHFTIWALTKSHLLLGTDLSQLSSELLEVVTNPHILRINQDEQFGPGIAPFRWTAAPNPPFEWEAPVPIFLSNIRHPAAFWSGRTSDGVVVLILNTQNSTQEMSFDLVEFPWLRAGMQYTALDLYKGTKSTIIRTFKIKDVAPHGCIVLQLTEDGPEPDGSGRPCQALDGFNCITQEEELADIRGEQLRLMVD